MLRNDAIPPAADEREPTAVGATLTEQEIIEQVRRGEIEVSEMKRSERERYGRYAPVWKQKNDG